MSRQLNGLLHEFAKVNTPTPNQKNEAKEKIDHVCRILQQKAKKAKIDRFVVAGSFQKSTTLKTHSDVDCVAFVNTDPPFDDILDEFDDIIDLNIDESRLTDRMKKKDRIVILQFTYDGIEFDILVAKNMVRNDGTLSHKELINRQYDFLLDHMKSLQGRMSLQDISLMYNAGLVELGVIFVKHQSGQVHELIRLAKFWNQIVYLGGYCSGRSSLIEMVAIIAAQEEERFSPSFKLLNAFRRFLQKMRNLSSLKHHWALEECGGYSAYEMSDIPREIKSQTPLLVDLVNPFCNRLAPETVSQNQRRIFEANAVETLERLERAEYASQFPCGDPALWANLFLPLPLEKLDVEIRPEPFCAGKRVIKLSAGQHGDALYSRIVKDPGDGSNIKPLEQEILNVISAIVHAVVLDEKRKSNGAEIDLEVVKKKTEVHLREHFRGLIEFEKVRNEGQGGFGFGSPESSRTAAVAQHSGAPCYGASEKQPSSVFKVPLHDGKQNVLKIEFN